MGTARTSCDVAAAVDNDELDSVIEDEEEVVVNLALTASTIDKGGLNSSIEDSSGRRTGPQVRPSRVQRDIKAGASRSTTKS
jgi:hypothetical protein